MSKISDFFEIYDFLENNIPYWSEYEFKKIDNEFVLEFKDERPEYSVHITGCGFKKLPFKTILKCGIHFEPYDLKDKDSYAIEEISGFSNHILGDFWLRGLHNLKTLKGCPEEIGGEFRICELSNITKLEHMPKKVGSISIGYMNLTKINDFPEQITSEMGTLELAEMPLLKSLKGIKVKTVPIFRLAWLKNLESLEGMPFVTKELYIKGCPKINIKWIKKLKNKISKNYIIYWGVKQFNNFNDFEI